MENLRSLKKPGFIKDDRGFTMIEALVGIVIFGIILSLTAAFVKGMFSHPKILLKNEALVLSNQEIEQAILSKNSTDTVYINQSGNMIIKRTISKTDSLKKISVEASFKSTGEEILKLTSYVAK